MCVRLIPPCSPKRSLFVSSPSISRVSHLAESDFLCEAAFYGDIALLSTLISKGVDVRVPGCCLLPTQAPPIWFAALSGQCAAMRLLARSGGGAKGFDMHSLLTAVCTSRTSLHYSVACQRADRPPPLVDYKRGIRTVVSLGVDINEEDTLGHTELYRAAALDHVECMRALLACGASVTCPEPLITAIKSNHHAAAELLLLAGTKPLATSYGEYPLLYACMRQKMLPLLLAHGAVDTQQQFLQCMEFMTKNSVRDAPHRTRHTGTHNPIVAISSI